MIVNPPLSDLILTFKEDKKNISQEIGNRVCFLSYAIYNVLWFQNGLLREPSQSISSENIDWINSWIFHLLLLPPQYFLQFIKMEMKHWYMYCFYLAENGLNYLCMNFDFPGNLKHMESLFESRIENFQVSSYALLIF